MSMQLPADVIAQRLPISATCYGYVLRHSRLGMLGTILVAHGLDGSCTVRPELAWGVSGAEQEEQRRAIFEPIARGWIASQFGLAMPSSSEVPQADAQVKTEFRSALCSDSQTVSPLLPDA